MLQVSQSATFLPTMPTLRIELFVTNYRNKSCITFTGNTQPAATRLHAERVQRAAERLPAHPLAGRAGGIPAAAAAGAGVRQSGARAAHAAGLRAGATAASQITAPKGTCSEHNVFQRS